MKILIRSKSLLIALACHFAFSVTHSSAEPATNSESGAVGLNKYIVVTEREMDKNDIVRRMSIDIELGDRGFLKLNPVLNAHIYSILDGQSIAERQREIVEPFLSDICSRMSKPNPDVSHVALTFEKAIEAEKTVVDDIYDAVVAELNNETTLNLQHLIDSTVGMVLENKIDWSTAAKLDRKLVASRFTNICMRSQEPIESSTKDSYAIELK